MEIKLRPLQTHADFEACVQLQKSTWGETFSECVPPAILMIGQKIGGVCAGAFNAKDEMVGFVFGLTGIKDDRLANWSHMLAVRNDLRGQGLGMKLKLYQRELLLLKGVEIIYWTYDPLVAKNAHLNLNKLGAAIQEYVQDMYSEDTGSDLHRGLGMDRFIVKWSISEKRVEQAISGKLERVEDSFKGIPSVNTESGDNNSNPVEKKLPEVKAVRVEIPLNIETIQQKDLQLAGKWRANTRRAFTWYLAKGYKIEGFYREKTTNRCFYVLRL